jgi:hypothetical protein
MDSEVDEPWLTPFHTQELNEYPLKDDGAVSVAVEPEPVTSKLVVPPVQPEQVIDMP